MMYTKKGLPMHFVKYAEKTSGHIGSERILCDKMNKNIKMKKITSIKTLCLANAGRCIRSEVIFTNFTALTTYCFCS